MYMFCIHGVVGKTFKKEQNNGSIFNKKVLHCVRCPTYLRTASSSSPRASLQSVVTTNDRPWNCFQARRIHWRHCRGSCGQLERELMGPERICLDYFHQGGENTQHHLSTLHVAVKEIKQLTATPFLVSHSFTHAHTEKRWWQMRWKAWSLTMGSNSSFYTY